MARAIPPSLGHATVQILSDPSAAGPHSSYPWYPLPPLAAKDRHVPTLFSSPNLIPHHLSKENFAVATLLPLLSYPHAVLMPVPLSWEQSPMLSIRICHESNWTESVCQKSYRLHTQSVFSWWSVVRIYLIMTFWIRPCILNFSD